MNNLSPKEKDLLARLKSTAALRSVFFNKAKDIKWLQPLIDEGYFAPENNPVPIIDEAKSTAQIPNWHAIVYLLNLAKNTDWSKHIEEAKIILKIIKNSTDYAKLNDYSNYTTWWKFAEILRSIPTDLLDANLLACAEFWLNDPYEKDIVAVELGQKIAPKLLNSEDLDIRLLALQLVGYIFKPSIEINTIDGTEIIDSKLKISTYYIKEIVDRTSFLIGKSIGKEGLIFFGNALKETIKKNNNDKWSAIWMPAIEDHEQNEHRENAENFYLTSYRNCLSGFFETNVLEAKKTVELLIEDELETFSRIAIYAVEKWYPILDSLTDDILQEKFFNDNIRHEIWHLLKNRYQSFTPSRKQTVLSIINNIIELKDDGSKDEPATAYRRSIWLSAIKDHGPIEYEQYKKVFKITDQHPEHPDFSSFTSSGWTGERAPATVQDLTSMEAPELVLFLNNFKEQNTYRAPTIRGLVDVFKEVIKSNASNFYNNFREYENLDLPFVNGVIESFNELWSDKAALPWGSIWPKLLNFCHSIITKEDFWSEQNKIERKEFVANRYWVVGSISRLITSATKSDEHAADMPNLDLMETIISILLDRESGTQFNLKEDAVHTAINSPKGKALEALINLSLRKFRLECNNSKTKKIILWQHFEHYFSAELKKADEPNPEQEFIVLLANYLPNFLYMSDSWTLEKLGSIFDLNDQRKWLCAIQGYSYVRDVYQPIYLFLRNNGHILRALDNENLENSVKDHLIQNVVIAYQSNFEAIDEKQSIITQLLVRNNFDELSHLIWFVWRRRKKSKKDFPPKVLDLWLRIEKITDFGTTEGKKIASNLCKWSAFIDNLDADWKPLLMKSAKYAGEDYNSPELIKNLARLSQSQAFEASDIMEQFLCSSSSDYPEISIRDIFKNLLKEGAIGKRRAKEIATSYLSNGNDRPNSWLNELIADSLSDH